MTVKEPPFTIGIEEEYLLVDRESRDLIREAPPTMLPECEELLEGQVGVDRGLHEQVREGGDVPMRDGRTRVERIGGEDQDPAVAVGTRELAGVDPHGAEHRVGSRRERQ